MPGESSTTGVRHLSFTNNQRTTYGTRDMALQLYAYNFWSHPIFVCRLIAASFLVQRFYTFFNPVASITQMGLPMPTRYNI